MKPMAAAAANRTHTLRFRVTPRELARMKELQKRTKQTLSALVRYLVLRELDLSNRERKAKSPRR